MAEIPPFSSQGSQYEGLQILQDDQENLSSSPPPRASQAGSPRRTSPRGVKSSKVKPKGLPTVTPKRFTKFFTPRSSLSGSGRQSKAARTLRDITKNGANRRPRTDQGKDDLLASLGGEQERPMKRRKKSLDITSSPLQSSPLKHVRTADSPPRILIYQDEPSSPLAYDSDGLPDSLEHPKPFPLPIRRLRQSNPSQRILQRSFGGYDALTRGRRGTDHCGPWQAETANFVSTPTDVHVRDGSLPFCTTSCNTNSLVAVGDEGGGICLFDSSPSADFTKTHVSFKPHNNSIMDLNFSADDYLLASASGDQTARVVDMHTQTLLCILTGHSSSVKQVRFQPNSDSVLTTSSRDGTVQVWDLRCSERGAASSLRVGQRRGMSLNEDGVEQASVRFATEVVDVGPAHRSSKGASILKSEEASVSITAIQHLPHGREHLLLTASELSASVKLWDLRTAGRARNALPLAATPLPGTHRKTRNFGVSSMALSGDGARLYTLCRDATVYAYSTNHLLLGSAPEMGPMSARRMAPRESKVGAGPLYGFRNPALTTQTFYIKSSLRPACENGSEMLAVGSSKESVVLFPTDERSLERPEPKKNEDDDDDDGLPSLSPKFPQAASTSAHSGLPIYTQGTALVRGHNKEVTSLSWTYDGELVTISDDYSVRCWREDADKARHLRRCGEGGGERWEHGWAQVDDDDWDDDDG